MLSLNHIVSRSIDPSHAVVVNAGALHSGGAPNVIPDTARVGCSIRTTSQADADIAYRRAEEVVRGICLAYGCTYTLDWVEPYAIVRNDPDLVDVALAAATRVLGEGHAYECPPMSGSEDFSAFSDVRPGAFILINAGDDDDGLLYENPKFDVVETALLDGTRTQVEIVLDLLGRDARG